MPTSHKIGPLGSINLEVGITQRIFYGVVKHSNFLATRRTCMLYDKSACMVYNTRPTDVPSDILDGTYVTCTYEMFVCLFVLKASTHNLFLLTELL